MGNRQAYAYGGSGQYLKAEEIAGKAVPVRICGVEDVVFDKGAKPVLAFQGKQKKLVVNATNFDVLAEAFGGFTENWTGKDIVLRGEKTSYQGKRVDCIRIAVPKADADLNDEIPEF
jgi:hypothetical protein